MSNERYKGYQFLYQRILGEARFLLYLQAKGSV